MVEKEQYPEEIIHYLAQMQEKVLPNYRDEEGNKYDCRTIASDFKKLCYEHGISAEILSYSSKEINDDGSGLPRYLRDTFDERLEPRLLEGILDGWEYHDVCYAKGEDGIRRVLDPVIGKPMLHEDYQRQMFGVTIQAHVK